MLSNWNILVWEYEFLQPLWLFLLLLVPIYFYFIYRRKHKSKGDVKFSGSMRTQKKVELKWVNKVRKYSVFLRVLAFVFLVLALSKPFNWENYNTPETVYKNGIDIILAMDVSGSMMATDFTPNRLVVSKEVAKQFVDDRKGDRIGLVAFSQEAYTACPATLDYDVLKKQIDELNPNEMGKLTAIGVGLGTAVARLRNDSLPSKVIILLTDGSNNAGDIDPLTAANLAKAKNIRVYTIGVGTNGTAKIPENTPFGVVERTFKVEIDEETLQNIASITGGQYFRATDEQSLKEIYAEIDKMERKKQLSSRFQKTPPATPNAFLNVSLLLFFLTFSFEKIIFKSND